MPSGSLILAKILIILFATKVNCENFDRFKESFSLVSGLIQDWNEKHHEVSDVVVINSDKKSVLTNAIVEALPKDNSVLVVDPEKCSILGDRKVHFVVILTEKFDLVRQI